MDAAAKVNPKSQFPNPKQSINFPTLKWKIVLVRASGSVAANWIEADEALSKKDFLMRVKICRKEAKESWLFWRLRLFGVWNFPITRNED